MIRTSLILAGLAMSPPSAQAMLGSTAKQASLKPAATPAVATPRPESPAKTPAEKRARLARKRATEERFQAQQALDRAQQAETNLQSLRREVESAEREILLTKDQLASARGDSRRANQELGKATKEAKRASQGFRATVMDSLKALLSLIAGTFGSFVNGEHSDVIPKLAASHQIAAEKGAAALAQRQRVERAVETLAERERRLGELKRRVAESARKSSDAVKDVERLASEARTAKAMADRTAQETEALERKAEAANYRYENLQATVDQRAHSLAKDAAAKASFRAARQRLQSAGFVESKPGEISQDAFATDPEKLLFALSDGVTHSEFPGDLARELVAAWVERPATDLAGFGDWLGAVQGRWRDRTEPKIRELKKMYFNRNKQDWTAHATFLGAQLVQEKHGVWQLRTTGIGDSVLFLVRRGDLERSFPIATSSEFGQIVQALPSNGASPFEVRQAAWDVREGDEVFMATDALAAWILAEHEGGRDPFAMLRRIETSRQMSEFVHDARDQKFYGRSRLNLDDTSFVRFVVPSPKK
jgi:hypothetical protein